VACGRNQTPNSVPPRSPTLRLYAMAAVAGAVEPCGCVSNMLGGIDHAAALVERGTREAPNTLVVAAGPLWFENPELMPSLRTQHLWKAEVLAAGLAELGLSSWVPAANDWAADASELERLTQRARATVLAGNLAGASGGAVATRIVE